MKPLILSGPLKHLQPHVRHTEPTDLVDNRAGSEAPVVVQVSFNRLTRNAWIYGDFKVSKKLKIVVYVAATAETQAELAAPGTCSHHRIINFVMSTIRESEEGGGGSH